MNSIDLDSIAAKINDGHRLIEEAIKELNSGGMKVIDYSYKERSLHLYDSRKFVETLPSYVVKPRASEIYPAVLSAKVQGVTFFTLSEKPLPSDTTMACVVKPVPVKEAI